MRGYLVVNPHATATSPRTRDVLVHALAAEHDIEVVETNHRGHAEEIGREARRQRAEIVVALGGDGTVNELVNGVLAEGGPGPDVPVITAVPAGSANVFSRALGFPADPVEATRLGAVCAGEIITHFGPRPETDLRALCEEAGVL